MEDTSTVAGDNNPIRINQHTTTTITFETEQVRPYDTDDGIRDAIWWRAQIL